MTVYPYCLCTVVSDKALDALLETAGRGTFRDDHPWRIAARFLGSARDAGAELALVLATGHPARFSHWGFIETLEVLELHRSSWETACRFSSLAPVNPIFEEVDSLFLKPADEQLEREELEGIHRHRHALTDAELRPYAICETPAFILREARGTAGRAGD